MNKKYNSIECKLTKPALRKATVKEKKKEVKTVKGKMANCFQRNEETKLS